MMNFGIRRIVILSCLIASALPGISFAASTKPVADFRSAGPLNQMGGTDWTFQASGASITAQYTEQLLRVTYDVTASESFAGYVMPFAQALDARPYNGIRISLRGGHGNEHVKIGIGDSNTEHKVLASQFITAGITTNWQVITIPLDSFTTLTRSSFFRVLIVFENQLGPESGTVDISGVSFVSTGSVLPAPVENFNDATSETGEGGRFWTTSGGGNIIGSSAGSEDGQGNGFQVTATVQPGSWATLAFELRGLNVRDQAFLTFSIKGSAGGEHPHIYLVSGPAGNEVRKYVELRAYATVTTDWQTVDIPLYDFSGQGLDLSQVTRCELVWEWEPLSETILLDNVGFRPAGSRPAPLRPSSPGWDFAASGGAVQVSTSGTLMQFSYDVVPPGSYSGHVMLFSSPTDTRQYDAVALRVRGTSGGEHVKIGLGDQNNEQKVLVSQFLRGGISTSWQSVLIPLNVFTSIDRQALNRIVIAFENQLGAEAGSVEMDDVRVVNTGTRLPVPVENFDDGTAETAEGGNFWAVAGGGGSINPIAVESGDGPGKSYRINVAVQPGAWAALAFDLRGLDIRDQDFLTFSIKGSTGGEQAHIYLVSGPPGNEIRQWVELHAYSPITPDWRRVSIPLKDFSSQGVDLSKATRCEFVWEWGSFSESIWLDNVSFTSEGNAPPPPLRLSDPGSNFTGSGGLIQVQALGSALTFTYDVSQPGSYSGYVIPLSHETDLSQYNAVAFSASGKNGGEHVKIGIGGNREQKVLVSQFSSLGITTTDQEFVIPLKVFSTVDLTSVAYIVVAFENQFGDAPNSSVSINSVRFVNTGSALALPVENFDDETSETAEGGRFWTTSGGGNISAVPVGGPAYRPRKSYQVAASVQPGSWAALAFELQGLDVRDQAFLTFLMKGTHGGEHPHIYLVSGAPGSEVRKFVALQDYATDTTSWGEAQEWQKITIPLHDFSMQRVDLSQVTRLELVWEWEPLSETILIDEVKFTPASEGAWKTLPALMPVNPVHMALMHNGKVLVVSGTGNLEKINDVLNTNYEAAVLDLQLGSVTTQPVSWDMFCNGMVILPNGDPFIVGGTKRYQPSFLGMRNSSAYDPGSGTFSSLESMHHGRWYPTVTTLGDGQVMAFSGTSDIEEPAYDQHGNPTSVGISNSTVEIFDMQNGHWSQEYPAPWTPPVYPRLHLLPDGTVFYSGQETQSRIFDLPTLTWSDEIAQTNYLQTQRVYGTSVLLPLKAADGYKPRVMILGGGDLNQDPNIDVSKTPLGTATTEIIDLSITPRQWVWGPPMSRVRIDMNATILPDGKIVALGGSAQHDNAATASLSADLYDPATNTFSSAGTNVYPRLYHSNALLLPDATVLVAGSNPGGFEQHDEIYSPPYLFNADGSPSTRPVITSVLPAAFTYHAGFQIQTSDAMDIRSVVLVRPGAVTHAFDMDQRAIELPFTAASSTLSATAPDNGNIAPPGYYMLFIVDSRGVPSTAIFVNLQH